MAKKTTKKKTTTRKAARRPAKKTAKRTTTKKKSTRRTTARKTTAKAKAKPAGPKKITGSADPRTRSQQLTAVAESCDMTRKEVMHVFDALEQMCVADLKKCGVVKFMGMKLTVKKAPAKPRRTGINPFTGEEQWFAAKPASKKVRARALKKLNDQI
ncbi:MAG: HU family DNA-binding protein [Planctomycetota bacterium]|nr:HU family DNA-binding protein [Planctomycetota bacterium]